MADENVISPPNEYTNDADLAKQNQPGTDLGNQLREEDNTLNAQNGPSQASREMLADKKLNPPDEPAAPSIGGPQAPDTSKLAAAPGAQPSQPAAPPQPSFASRMAHMALNLIGGSPTITYAPDGKGGVVGTPQPKSAADIGRGLIAGALTGLASASNAHATGLGGLGVGAEGEFNREQQADNKNREFAQQNAEGQQKQATIDLAKQREQREQTQDDREFGLRKQEDARQQATSIQQASAFEKRSVLLDQEISKGNFDAVKQQAEYLQDQSDKWNDLQAHGAERLKVDGATSPDFEHLGDAEEYAMQHQDQVMHDNYKTRLMRNPSSGKWEIMETPYEAPKWHEITDASGAKQRIYGDTMDVLAKQEQVAKTRHYLNVAAKSSLDLKKELEEYKEEGTSKFARKELTKVGGDYSKLSPGSKAALVGDAQKRFSLAQTGLEKELAKPPELRDEASVDLFTKVRNEYATEVAALTKPSWAPSNNAPPPAAPQRPANVPSDYVFTQNGPGGKSGWMRPTAGQAGIQPPEQSTPAAATEDNPNPGNEQD